jgi:hypothetical protein
MTTQARRKALEATGMVHPSPEAVSASLFDGRLPFFLREDKVQVKYEMLRAHIVDGVTVASAAGSHGYSRASYYLVATAFGESGMSGLVDERRGRRGPLKLRPDVMAFITGADPATSGAELAEVVASALGVSLHRRTVERARRR